jgi:O-6-methylguanine DNA methyltransferase
MDERTISDTFPVPGGWVGITLRKGHAVSIALGNSRKALDRAIKKSYPLTCFIKIPVCRKEITGYLKGREKRIRLKYRLVDITPLQTKMLLALKTLPYGKTISYAGLARLSGNKKFARAAGTAMARNPLPLLFPCHRVVCSDGTEGGFMGKKKDATGWKSRLLRLEQPEKQKRKNR